MMKRLLCFLIKICLLVAGISNYFSFNTLKAQESQLSCEQLLREALVNINEAPLKVYEALKMSPCISSTNRDKSLKVKLLELLILSTANNLAREPELADSIMIELLKIDPEYQLKSIQFGEKIRERFDKFRTWPIYYVNAFAGINFVFPDISQRFGIDNSIGTSKTESYTQRFGYQVGLQTEIPISINRNLTLGTGVQFITHAYDYTHTLETVSSPAFDFARINFTENQQWVTNSLYLKYRFQKAGLNKELELRGSTISPFVYVGIGGHFLLESKIKDIRRTVNLTADPLGEITPIQNSKIGIANKRYRANLSLIGGAGVNIKIGINYLVFDVRFSRFLFNIVDGNERYNWKDDEQKQLLYLYGHVDNNLLFNALSFSVGYSFSIYKPIKLSEDKYNRR